MQRPQAGRGRYAGDLVAAVRDQPAVVAIGGGGEGEALRPAEQQPAVARPVGFRVRIRIDRLGGGKGRPRPERDGAEADRRAQRIDRAQDAEAEGDGERCGDEEGRAEQDDRPLESAGVCQGEVDPGFPDKTNENKKQFQQKGEAVLRSELLRNEEIERFCDSEKRGNALPVTLSASPEQGQASRGGRPPSHPASAASLH